MEHYKLKCFHSDRGGEYVNKQVKDPLLEVGIEHKLTVPHSPQQNGRAERFNRTIMEKGTSMLHNAGLSLGFWEQAVMTANYIYNRTPIALQNGELCMNSGMVQHQMFHTLKYLAAKPITMYLNTTSAN